VRRLGRRRTSARRLDDDNDRRGGIPLSMRGEGAMPRVSVFGDQRRHLIQLPQERREAIGFVLDRVRGQIIAPWGRKKGTASDEERLDALLARIEADRLPACGRIARPSRWRTRRRNGWLPGRGIGRSTRSRRELRLNGERKFVHELRHASNRGQASCTLPLVRASSWSVRPAPRMMRPASTETGVGAQDRCRRDA
jgi:hypothetical protein